MSPQHTPQNKQLCNDHTFEKYLVQPNLDLRNSNFPFLNGELFDLRKIYVLNLKTGRPEKMPYVGEIAR